MFLLEAHSRMRQGKNRKIGIDTDAYFSIFYLEYRI
jgi:hypothetical protein